MSARSKLKRALQAIDDAQTKLRFVQNDPQAQSYANIASRELDDAIGHIKGALKDLPGDV